MSNGLETWARCKCWFQSFYHFPLSCPQRHWKSPFFSSSYWPVSGPPPPSLAVSDNLPCTCLCQPITSLPYSIADAGNVMFSWSIGIQQDYIILRSARPQSEQMFVFQEAEPFMHNHYGYETHGFGGGSSFFGTHFGNAHHQSSSGRSCRTVTQRVGNMVTTYTQCS